MCNLNNAKCGSVNNWKEMPKKNPARISQESIRGHQPISGVANMCQMSTIPQHLVVVVDVVVVACD